MALLNSARESGALAIEPDKALEFLRQFHHLALDLNYSAAGWERKLCAEYGFSPSTIALLGGVLRRCPTKGQQDLAKKLMLAASAMGEKSATFDIISSAIRLQILHEYPTVMQRLGVLAKRDNDLQAMTLLGKVLFAQRKDGEALQWFRKATQPPTGSLEFDGAGDALVLEARILLQRNEKYAAKSVFQRAALELDDPTAYFYLSQLQDPGSPDQEIYLMKAATSGVAEACHNLGVFELSKMRVNGKKVAALKDYGMAREWFEVAATDGFGLSMLNMASIYRNAGNLDDAMKWLQKAQAESSVAQEANKLAEQWEINAIP